MKRYIALCLLLLTGMIAVAQQGINLQVLTPPPPDVSALGKFGLVPVDNFTGVPSISIPVYTIKEGTLEFPVSLQYHAGGIKVKEEASEVGLGWALSASGSIVSVTRGQPDFPGGFANSYLSMPDPPAMQGNKSPYYSLNGWYYQWINDLDLFGNYPGTGLIYSGLTLNKNGVVKQYMNEFTVGYDGQAPDFASDLYIITIGARSYRFIFDNNFKPVVLGDGSLKIEMINDGNYPNWKVTDETGTAYYFEKKQFYYSNNTWPANIGTAPQLNTWHLSRIVSPTYGEINFQYLHSTQDFTEPMPNISQTYLVGNVSTHTQQQTNKVDASYTMYQQLNIDAIQFTSGTVKFLYDPVRLDLKGAKRLQSIEVRDKNDRLVKKINLDNNYYFNAAADNSGFSTYLNLGMFSADNKIKRLKLNSVSEVDVLDPAKYKKYTFTYNEQLNLPSKLSLEIDHWGHYNGAPNTELVPPATLYLSSSPTALEFTGANRNANPDYMQANTLTAIQYPTGGTSDFTYETNQFTRTETVITYHDENSELYKAANSATLNNSGFVDANGDFTVASGWVGKKLKIVSIVTRNSSYPPNPYTLDIVVKKDGFFLKRIPVATVIGTSTDIDESITLEAGNYNISYDAFTTDFFNSCEIRRSVIVLNASMTSEQVLKTVYSAGLRISKIKNIDPVSGNTNTKTYTYSNGTADDLPVYESAEGYDPYDIGLGHFFRYRYGQSIYPFSDGRNAPYFGYQKVEVRDVDNANNSNGLSEYNYSTSGSININTMARYNTNLDHPLIINPIMAPIPDIPSGDRGKLMLEKYYKLVNSTLVPVSSTSYYYTRDNSTTIWQMLFNQGLSNFLPPGFNSEQEFRIHAHHFPIPVLRNMLRRKENNVYDAAGNISLSQFEDYTYDNVNGHYQLIKKSTQNSKSDELNTLYKYPQDYGDLSSVSSLDQESLGIKLLQQTHVVTPVEIYTEQIKAGTTDKIYLGGQINIFNNNLPTPKQILVIETATPLIAFTPSTVTNGAFSRNNLYKSRIRFTQYDVNGRLLEQYKENDLPHSYIWDYKNSYPIAEVSNAFQSAIAYTSFESDGSGKWVIPSATRDNTGLPITGKASYNLSNGAITKNDLSSTATYIISYWTKGANALVIAGTQGQAIQGKTVNNWTYFQHYVSGITQANISGSGLIDELRLYPKDAVMTTYTYDPLIGITSQCDANNRITYYEYDGFNRLILIRDMDNNILKKICYNYAGQVEDCTVPCTNLTPNWQNTTMDLRCQQGSCGNTGYQEQEQRDINPCSPTYNQYQWVTAGYNPTACTVPTCVTLTSTNTNSMSGYTASYYNTMTGYTYDFSVPTGTSLQTLGTIPEGNYTLTISRTTGIPVNGTFKSGCFKQTITGTSATFYNVGVTTVTCNSITITIGD